MCGARLCKLSARFFEKESMAGRFYDPFRPRPAFAVYASLTIDTCESVLG